MNNKFKSIISSLILNIVFWVCVSGLYLIVRFWGTTDKIDWASNMQALIVLWLIVGTFYGIANWLINLITDSEKMRKKTYGFLISIKVFGVIVITLMVIFTSRVAGFFQGTVELNQIIPSFFVRATHPAGMAILIYAMMASFMFSLIRQMKIMVGGRVLFNLITGKYHVPKVENRIFMFLDLKSSTYYAEKLGHIKFSMLIQDCFYDLTDSAIKYGVEIYQYVGDSVILTWIIKNGIKNENCIRIFFDFENKIKNKSEYYKKRFGFIPEFKSGLNLGPVTVSEIGILKRNIAYLSDVLNTAARIQDKCNDFEEKILISGKLMKQLPASLTFKYNFIGKVVLKGKETHTQIYGVDVLAP